MRSLSLIPLWPALSIAYAARTPGRTQVPKAEPLSVRVIRSDASARLQAVHSSTGQAETVIAQVDL